MCAANASVTVSGNSPDPTSAPFFNADVTQRCNKTARAASASEFCATASRSRVFGSRNVIWYSSCVNTPSVNAGGPASKLAVSTVHSSRSPQLSQFATLPSSEPNTHSRSFNKRRSRSPTLKPATSSIESDEHAASMGRARRHLVSARPRSHVSNSCAADSGRIRVYTGGSVKDGSDGSVTS
jgi:hypothetical protein